MLRSFLDEFRFAARRLHRSPVFAVIVMVTLAIGIGANTAAISVIDRAFFRTLPVPDPGSVFSVTTGDVRDGNRRPSRNRNSFADYEDLQSRVTGVSGLAAYSMSFFTLGGDQAGARPYGAFVSGTYFDVLGIRAAQGRLITPDETSAPGRASVAVISDALWKSRFGGDEAVIGRTLIVGSSPFTIIGLTPPGFTGLEPEGRTDLWIPYTMQAEATGQPYTFQHRDARMASIFGRLSPNATLEAVKASLDRAASDLAATYPVTNASLRFGVAKQDRLVTATQAASALATMLILWAMIAVLHLVACSNVASLMLARVAARRRELGIRLCLGASTRRIIIQALAEPALLALGGAAGGVLIARGLTRLIVSMHFMSAMDPGVDLRVLAVVALTAVATVFVFGMPSAHMAARRDPLTVLRGGSGGNRGPRDRSTPLLVTIQVAVSLLLLANAAVLTRTLERQLNENPGYDAEHLLISTVRVREHNPSTDWTVPIQELTDRLAAHPGITRATVAGGAPLLQHGWTDEVLVPGHDYRAGESRRLSVQIVGPGFFAGIGATMLAGREFDPTDRIAPGAFAGFTAVVVNRTFARWYWPDQEAVGKQVRFRNRWPATVVGVVEDIHDVRLSFVVPRAYFPSFQWRAYPRFDVVVRTAGDPETLQATVDAIVTSWAAALPADAQSVRTMRDVMSESLMVPRSGAIAVGVGAGIALLLTVIGLYGLVSAWSDERRGEIGIRMALGARAWHVHRLLIGRVAVLVGWGTAVGLAIAIGMIQVERRWWGPSITLEVIPLVVAGLVLGLAVGLAAYLPSRQATKADPVGALRSL